MIDLPPQQLSMVRAVLNAVVPGVPAFAFGSRVTGRAKKHSDLDLALQPVQPLDWRQMANLREAFEASELPIRVDVVDWAVCSDAFKAHASPLHKLG
jgi:predicted nucleotidyltransferase